MKKLLLFAIIFFSASLLFALPGGKGPAGKTIELHASGGYVPYAHFRIKDRDYNFYYTGYKYDASLTYYSSGTFHSGLYFVNMKLNNKLNNDSDKEKIDVKGLGLTGYYVAPFVIKPFLGLGIGYYIATINQGGTHTLEHFYKQGIAGRLSIGIGPTIRGLGFYLKWEGEYVAYDKGENKNDESEKLFDIRQDSYSINIGIQMAI